MYIIKVVVSEVHRGRRHEGQFRRLLCGVEACGREEEESRCHWLLRRYKYRQMAFTGSEQAETPGEVGRQAGSCFCRFYISTIHSHSHTHTQDWTFIFNSG